MLKPVLALVGGGHAHLQVILNLPSSVPSAASCILISEVTHAAYSGLLPAVIAGLVPEHTAYTALRPLAHSKNFTFLHARVTSISSSTNSLTYVTHASPSPQALHYDILSINVGSNTLPLRITSQSAVVIPTRPIGALLPALRQFEVCAPPAPRVVVVGAGAAGVELALALEARLMSRDERTSVTLVSRGSVQDSFDRPMAAAVAAELRRRQVDEVVATAMEVEGGVLKLAGGGSVSFDCLVLATGASPHEWLAKTTDLTVEDGWLLVGKELRVVGSDNVFATGDCVSFGSRFGYGFPPRAGVYAVRQGPVLTHNLRVILERNGVMKAFAPQSSFLSLLSMGDGRGIGTKYGLVFKGTWVFRLKSFIDEGWQQNFRVGGDGVENGLQVSFEGSPAEGAAILQAAEDVLIGDSFEGQLMVLRRMDVDEIFRNELLNFSRIND